MWLLLLLQREQLLLARETRGVAAQPAVGAHGAMTGHHQRDRVGAAGASHRAYRIGSADRPGDVLVCARFAARDAAQLVPHPALENGAADVEWDAREAFFTRDEVQDGLLSLRHRLFRKLRLAELLGKEALQPRGVIAELDRADAFVGSGDEH